jgi:hypothetical protein
VLDNVRFSAGAWCDAVQVKDATLKKVKTLEEQKEAVETERDTLKVRCHYGLYVQILGTRLVHWIQRRSCRPLSQEECIHYHQRDTERLLQAASRAAATYAPLHTALRAECGLELALKCGWCVACVVACLQAAVASLERDVEAERHATTAEKKRLAELAHERDVLNKLRTQVGAGMFKACSSSSSTTICMCSMCVKTWPILLGTPKSAASSCP